MRTWKAALALALVALPLGAGAAQAQAWDRGGPDRGYFDTSGWAERFSRRLEFVSARIDQAIAERRVSWREARGLREARAHLQEARHDAFADRYVTRGEREQLESQLDILARRLRIDVNGAA